MARTMIRAMARYLASASAKARARATATVNAKIDVLWLDLLI